MAMNRVIRILSQAVLFTGLLAATDAGAQRFERGGVRPDDASSAPRRSARGRDAYAVPPGASGTITASTPNESGNLGGPGTGGGGGAK